VEFDVINDVKTTLLSLLSSP